MKNYFKNGSENPWNFVCNPAKNGCVLVERTDEETLIESLNYACIFLGSHKKKKVIDYILFGYLIG